MYKHLGELGKVVVQLLKERTVCQRYEPDEEEDDAAAEHDFVLIDVVSDVIAALAKVRACVGSMYLSGARSHTCSGSDVAMPRLFQGMGPSCEPHIRPMLKPLLKYCRPSRPIMDRAMAVGLIAEIAEGIGAAVAPHVPALWPVIYASMRDANPKLQVRSVVVAMVAASGGGSVMPYAGIATARASSYDGLMCGVPPSPSAPSLDAWLRQRNGSFACGYVLSRAGGTAAGPVINDALSTLHTLATSTGVEAVVHDNALGAIARLVRACRALSLRCVIAPTHVRALGRSRRRVDPPAGVHIPRHAAVGQVAACVGGRPAHSGRPRGRPPHVSAAAPARRHTDLRCCNRTLNWSHTGFHRA